ncbi:MAG: hypothetical protein WAN27_20640 [Xanthobacteraceae bacterium]
MKKYSTLAFTAIALGYAIGASAIHSGAHAQGAQIEDMKIEDMKIDDMQIDDAQIKEGKTKDARVRTPTKLCNSECLAKQIDTLNQKVEALERTVGALVIEANKSIKAGQKIILRTDPGMRGGGCLTYVGPSGDLGGFVSWNVNCSHGTSWLIK